MLQITVHPSVLFFSYWNNLSNLSTVIIFSQILHTCFELFYIIFWSCLRDVAVVYIRIIQYNLLLFLLCPSFFGIWPNFEFLDPVYSW
jgi:hypothetical protein